MFFLQDAGIMKNTYCCVPVETAVCAYDVFGRIVLLCTGRDCSLCLWCLWKNLIAVNRQRMQYVPVMFMDESYCCVPAETAVCANDV